MLQAVLSDNRWLIYAVKRRLITLIQLFRDGRCTYPCFPAILFTSTPHKIHSKPLASLPRNSRRKKMDGSERGINPVAMSVINLRKEYWQSRGSNQRFSSPVGYRLSYGGSAVWQQTKYCGRMELGHGEDLQVAKHIDLFQPARIAHADMSPYILRVHRYRACFTYVSPG